MLKVVVVDDSLQIQKSLGRLLGSISGVDVAGYAQDVTGALSVIGSVRPDVVVLDIHLLEGDQGIDVLRGVRRQWPQTKVIALSNDACRQLGETYVQAGASAYFDKALQCLQARDWIAAQVVPPSAADAVRS